MLVRGQKKALFQSSFQVRRTLPSSLPFFGTLTIIFQAGFLKSFTTTIRPDLSPKNQAFVGGECARCVPLVDRLSA